MIYDETCADLIGDAEQVELFAEPPVVPLFDLFEERQVLVQGGGARKGRPVDPGQHLILLVAPPVRARQTEELERLYFPGRREVWPPAEVREAVLRIDAYLGVFDPADKLFLERLPETVEQIEGLGLADYAPHNGQVPLDDLAHPSLYPGQVFLREAGLVIEIVVKARLYSGPYRYLRFREKLFYRLGHHVRRAMAQNLDPFGRVDVYGRKLAIPDGRRQIVRLTVHHDRDDPAVELVQPLEKICKGAAFFRNSVFLILKSYNQS